ncbi:hypothetical protein [Pseudotabrizicola alkalilacus]|uniref:Uncharacterized protein n=1 Tax=Pseudotabrizicola alkalilacus TaxID=2305252 RepID=A0A411YXG3_9RHOB|nr:hypothetical protein [Pseudotabrizicola alkalilacus]RGP35561.1 hypothetical protein D1012_19335 [Pseudotabrizicola alkalilacus]
MSDQSTQITAAIIGLSVEEREKVVDHVGELVAVHVYRELQIKNKLAEVAGCNIIGNCSNGSCDIIGNCSSSSKDVLVRAFKGGATS